jgi:gamma-glutamyltranspeptidase/glutathione hydrolase
MPPPSSGGVAIATMLNVLEPFDLAGLGHNSPEYLHLLAEAMRRAFQDRAAWLADPDVVDVPVHRLTSTAHAEALRTTIDLDRASVSSLSDLVQTAESMETTHYSVVDGEGLAVSVTYTLEAGYGSGIVVPGAGFLLNNEMGDFNAGPGLTNADGLIGTAPNLARPGQRMLSSMSPSIVTRDGELAAVVGSPGGRTIINTVLQVILNLTVFQMPLPEAIAAPRIHHQWLPDRVSAEESMEPAALAGLEAMGHTVSTRGRQGLAHSIQVEPGTGLLIGQPDLRNPDAAAAGVR